VLAAGADENAVRFLLAATEEVAQTQAGGGKKDAIATAMQHRRTAVDGVVDAAVSALRRWDEGAESRRAEIRTVVDQLSRLPELADAWLDGTLRELPEETLGFTSFADMAVPERKGGAAKPKPKAPPPKARPAPGPTKAVEAPVDTPEIRAARAAKVAAERQARKDLAAANRDLITATRKLETARAALRDANEAVERAEADHAAVIARRTDAEQRLT
jgi:hypothetical protein